MRILWIIPLLLLLQTLAYSQYKQGEGELFILGTIGFDSHTSEQMINGSDEGFGKQTSERSHLYLAATPAYYIANGVSLELELGLNAIKNLTPTQSAVLHLSYTQSRRRSPIAWFIRGGYGLANGLSQPLFWSDNRISNDLDVQVMSFGAGLKIRPGGRGLIRIEANYRLHMYDYKTEYYTNKHSYDTIAVLLGLGLLL